MNDFDPGDVLCVPSGKEGEFLPCITTCRMHFGSLRSQQENKVRLESLGLCHPTRLQINQKLKEDPNLQAEIKNEANWTIKQMKKLGIKCLNGFTETI